MRLLLPPGRHVRNCLLTVLCLLVFAMLGTAQVQRRARGASLHVIGTPKTAAAQTAAKLSGSSSCMSVAQIARQRIAGQLATDAPVELCQGSTSASNSSQSPAGETDPNTAITIEPSRADQASAAEANVGGFSGFLVAPSYPTQTTVASSVTTVITLSADFMKHGRKDLLTFDTKAQLHLLSHQCEGSFASPVTSSGMSAGATYTSYMSALVDDYDNDGYPDVIARNGTNFRLIFFHNNHDGTFTQAKSIQLPSCYYAGAMLLGDVTNDGVNDLIVFVTSYSYSPAITTMNVLVYAGDGTGDFKTTPIETDYDFPGAEVMIPNRGAVLSSNVGRKSLYIEALSLNDYGINGATVFALGLNGDGTFLPDPYAQQDFVSDNFYVNTNNGGLSMADLNGDGIHDITMNFYDYYIYTALGAADGSFPTVVNGGPKFAILPQSWEVTDIDGDGYPDFVVKDINTVEVLPGLGTGIFGEASNYYTVANSNSGGTYNSPGFNMVLDDFDGDGHADIVYVDAAYNGYNRAVLLRGRGDASFQGPVALPANNQLGYDPGHLYGDAMFDTNGDGRADIIVQDTSGLGPFPYRTALSDGKGGFTLVKAIDCVHDKYTLNSILASGDFNLDGRKDLVFDALWSAGSYVYDHTLAIALSKGDGTFADPTFIDMSAVTLHSSLRSVAVGDINGDGVADIVAVTTGGYYDAPAIITILGNNDGSFQPAVAQSFGTSYTYAGVALADFNGDGKLDLFISDDGSGTVTPHSSIIPGDNSGVFNIAKAVTITSGLSIRTALVGDLNGDGKPDLALVSAGVQSGYSVTTANRGLNIYLNKGDGTFTAGNIYENGVLGSKGLLADVNGDGKLDVVYTVDYPWNLPNTSNAGAQLLLGGGDGTFGAPTNLMLPPSVSLLASGDLEGDGALDLMSFSFYVGSVAVLRNVSGSSLNLVADTNSINQGDGVTFTAFVQPTVDHRPTLTGDVKFQLNGQTLGTAPLQAGSASLYVDSLPVGSNTITAVYVGDANYSSNFVGASVTVKVAAAPVVSPDFVLSVPSGGLTIARGSNASLSFSLAANAGFDGTVSLTATNLPAGMSVNFAPSSVTLKPGQTATATIFVSTTTSASSSAKLASVWIVSMPVLGSLFCLAGFRRRSALRAMVLTVLLGTLGTIAMLTSCGGGSAVRTAHTGDYTIVVKATPSVSGIAAKAFNVTVHVD